MQLKRLVNQETGEIANLRLILYLPSSRESVEQLLSTSFPARSISKSAVFLVSIVVLVVEKDRR
jgi:hypothetical protein